MRHTSTTGSIRVMYTTSTLWIPWKAQDRHRSPVRVGGCSVQLLSGAPQRAHLQQHDAGPASKGPSPSESPGVSRRTQPGVTQCWPVLCCLTPSCCCCPPWGQSVGEEVRSEPWSKPCLQADLCLGAQQPLKGLRGTSLPCTVPKQVFFSNWGGFPVDLKQFTPFLWKSGLEK